MVNQSLTGYKGIDQQDKDELHYWSTILEEDMQMSGFAASATAVQFNECVSDQQCYNHIIDVPLAQRMISQCRGNKNALFLFMLSSLNLLLSKYNCNSDILVGIPPLNNGGKLSQVSSAKLLPIRTQVNWTVCYKHYLASVKQIVSEAYLHQNLAYAEYLNNTSGNSADTFKTIVMFEGIHPSVALENLGPEILFKMHEEAGMITLSVYFNNKYHIIETVQQYVKHLTQLLNWLTLHPDETMEQIDLLTTAEQDNLLQMYSGFAESTASNLGSVVEHFEIAVRQHPTLTAVIDNNQSLSYEALNDRANQLAHFLLKHNIDVEEPVGILLPQSVEQAVAMLGVLKASATFVPLDVENPEERIRTIIKDAGIKILISSKKYIRILNRLQWECPEMKSYICLDSIYIYDEVENEANSLMDENLWEYMGSVSVDDITGGGWVNSYTGLNFSQEEMDEYGDNVLAKLRPYLNRNQKVLEIGCASGITMFRIAPLVLEYYGTDLSGAILEKNQLKIDQQGIKNIRLGKMPAHEVGFIPGNFDVIIMNSVVQCFHGHNYFRQVLSKAIEKIPEQGIIFIGDIMDLDSKSAFTDSLHQYASKLQTAQKQALKLEWEEELFLSRAFFEDLQCELDNIESIEFTGKQGNITNELTEYRYDVLLVINKLKKNNRVPQKKKNKYQFSRSDLNSIITLNNPDRKPGPDNLAYIIYTSGTTGTPKGVMIEHRGLVHLCEWHNQRFQVTSNDKATRYAGFGFDASVWELFPYLLKGAAVYYIDNFLKLDMLKLNRYFEEKQITISFLPTQVCEQFMEFDNQSLRYLLTGGDSLRIIKPTSYKIVNNYGPTENTVVTTSGQLNINNTVIPIGMPIANVAVYIMDAYGHLQPIGASGELFIAGPGLSRGYLKRDKLTTDKFIANPFVQGTLMFKSGDLGRWLPDGEIEFLGRADQQVKIRGYRIELGEIDNKLLKLPYIKESVVIDRLEEGGDRYLCAYYVANNSSVDVADIRKELSKELPEYMIPAYFVELKAMPLTSNGKVNRKVLPEPEERLLTKLRNYRAPMNEIEIAVCEIWQDVLAVNKIGVTDNFFEVGGNSLKAVRVISKLSEQFEVGINQLFQYPTVETLATQIHFKGISLEQKIEQAKQWISRSHNRAEQAEEIDDKMKRYSKSYNDELYLVGEQRDYKLPKQILLTGASGYLGIHLLYEILVTSQDHIYILKRGLNERDAVNTLIRKIEFYFGASVYEEHKHRIHVICGDLTKVQFGVDSMCYYQLINQIDTVLHAAANVKHYGALDDFYKVNVTGTEHIIDFALSGREKCLHFISTVGIASGTVNNQPHILFTEDDCNVGQQIDNFYTQTKLEAELMVLRACREGLTAKIYRVGNLVCHSESGKFQENIEENGFYKTLKSFIRLRKMPEQSPHHIDFTFVNSASKAILLLMGVHGNKQAIYHVYNHKFISLLQLNQMFNESGLGVEAISPPAFLDFLYSKRNETYAEEYVENILLHSRILNTDETFFTMISEKTVSLLQKLKFEWPAVSEEHIRKMTDYCKEVNFI
ncbi:AMP-binding protein [Paenibacillus typhae]|uniref:Amino acid adenylation domain-containing protein/thioester reductase domain-containing protein n=1 Tax=Paenibacillus typhae TaxID=1174501 RepID=A0A1G8F8W8_9BACL|nr:AMP-binding protein [Paenibacillus typhae]SDH78429.1 amino acid adenylation domain-containing protein/thioester reductase domain-containing protein [Paenibacillus typhae]